MIFFVLLYGLLLTYRKYYQKSVHNSALSKGKHYSMQNKHPEIEL